MTVTQWLGAAMAAALISSAIPTTAQATTYDVFKVKMGLAGVAQDDEGGVPHIVTVKANKRTIINLARGRNLDSAVPTNEVLALAADCEGSSVKLIVFDKNTSSNLVTIASIEVGGRAMQGRNGESVVAFAFQATGGVTNRINGGYLSVVSTFNIYASGCLKYLVSTSMNGVLDVSGVDDVGPFDAQFLIKSGTLETVEKIGQWVED